MNLIDRIAYLRALDPDQVWSVEDYMQIVEMLPGLLAALDFQPGDADILYWMLTGVGDDPTQDEIAELLSRYQAMASKMTEERK